MPGHHPSRHARTTPDALAMIVADTGETLSYRELDEGSNRVAQLLRSLGLRPGDRIAVMLRNSPEFSKVYWGATRCGCFVTLLSTHLRPSEASYIVGDAGAKVLFLSASIGETPCALARDRAELAPGVSHVFFAGDPPGEGAMTGAVSLDEVLASMPAEPVADEISGFHMIYSSGTTGRPKGIVLPFTPGPIDEFNALEGALPIYQELDPLVSLNVGPLYHGAPLSGMVTAQRLGGTFVTQRKFDAEGVLAAIERYRVNIAQFVPTMFVRKLALPDDVRAQYDMSSLRLAIHAAAPCPVEIKRRMIDWWGPIIFEYYGSTEGVGATAITSQEWLERPGSVGRSSLGPIHICDEEGRELPPGESGIVYFEAMPGRSVNYLNDAEKTRSASHPQHPDWFAVGDIGRLDEDGYLYLTDRKDFMIISGGVNIYPQAIEDCLIVHPQVLDVAVLGVADPEYGEKVKAVVQPKDWADAGPELEASLRDWCGGRISAVTAPREYEFVKELPRLPSGKLAKHELRKLYGNAVAVA
ncbi:putative acyl-CoA ligase [Novosphingobium endophyticum]|uniref:Acyl-CoA ligase n=1 Tax=Novosphingobium endophyticum TaxID=1955250 RepID=A0A916X529_9SPHN|nr:AMP-binding protein [Novosphingobium endophyticum]GGC05327.1 putative acyl-CoA ligase [Novosphingobium endophyticum]